MSDSELSTTLEHGVETGCDNPNSCSSSACPAHSSCQLSWNSHRCDCEAGYVGAGCHDVCHLNPCRHNSSCARDPAVARGYRCDCASPLESGAWCEVQQSQPCPALWWGYPVCGPCQCDTAAGLHPDCDKQTGECRCEDFHYRPAGSSRCLPCECFPAGSTSTSCHPTTGQCQCRPGVSGRLCDSCSHKFAEVTETGCEVVYQSCPKSFVSALWWPRSKFGRTVEVECPAGSEGKAVRRCEAETGWAEPDLFNCTHRQMLPLFQDLAQLQNNEIQMNSYLTLKTARNLFELTGSLTDLYGADLQLISRLLTEILQYETEQTGFNLSHKQEREFVKQIVHIASRLLEPDLEQQTDAELVAGLLELFRRYGATLAANLADTYTNPFEVVAPNLMFGLDTVETRAGNPQSRVQPKGLHSSAAAGRPRSDSVIIPKYNHFMRDPAVWDNSRLHLPASLLSHSTEPAATPTVSYAIYRTVAQFLPARYHPDLAQRWGSYFRAVSPVVALTVLGLPDSVDLLVPVSIIFRAKLGQNYPRAAPFCARWDAADPGWTREGCETDLPDLWQFNKASEVTVNCSCYRVSSYAVLTETAASGVQVLSPLISDNIVFYAAIASLLLLLVAALAFSLLYGLPTNTNSIHRYIVLCLFTAQLLFIIAAKYHHVIVKADFACKMIAILLHYFWLSVFSWLLVDSLHLQRMLTELRDINHGAMKFYVAMGFGVPAVIVGLSVGVRGHQYGNLHFCWLSLYDVSVWSLVGPLCLSLLMQIVILFLAIRAAFTLKSQIEDFGNLRGLLLLNIGLLPLATGTWTCAFFLVNEDRQELTVAFSVSTLLTSVYILVGYVVCNGRVRAGLRNR